MNPNLATTFWVLLCFDLHSSHGRIVHSFTIYWVKINFLFFVLWETVRKSLRKLHMLVTSNQMSTAQRLFRLLQNTATLSDHCPIESSMIDCSELVWAPSSPGLRKHKTAFDEEAGMKEICLCCLPSYHNQNMNLGLSQLQGQWLYRCSPLDIREM